VLAVTGSKDLQVDPADLEVVAATVPGPVETRMVPDLTHTLRRQTDPPSMSRYRAELRRPVDAELLRVVTCWARRTTGLAG
jgi:uncharacterized protein